MDPTFSAEQIALREATREFLRDQLSATRPHGLLEPAFSSESALWRRLTRELGLTGLAVPEKFGGVDATFVDVAIVLEETGRALLAAPYLSTVVAATILAEIAKADTMQADFAAETLPQLATGTMTAALVTSQPIDAGKSHVVAVADPSRGGYLLTGSADHVLDGSSSGLFLVVASVSGRTILCGVRSDADGMSVIDRPTLDQTRAQATVQFRGTPAVGLTAAGDVAAVDRAVDLLRVGLAVESVGAARHCLDVTVEYLKTRQQFGRPIGSFQALKHRCADLAVEVESAVSTAYHAAWAATDAPAELPVVAPLAKAHCADVFLHVSAEMIQMHGGIGFTWEHEAHRYYKRAKSTQLLCGSARQLRAEIAARAGLY